LFRLNPSSRSYTVLCALWSLVLASTIAVVAVHALAPGLDFWRVDETSQPGQLTLYNDYEFGGFYGLPVEIGDFDGDSHLDFVLAPMNAAAGPSRERAQAGEVYVYPGTGSVAGIIDRRGIPASERGLTLWGARSGDFLGTELFSADVDTDGITDLLTSAQNYDLILPGEPPGVRENCGAVFVVLGREGLLDGGPVIDMLSPPAGVITVVGAEEGERLGIWVETGDLDGDGLEDLLLGADQFPAEPRAGEPRTHRGKVYVVYGRRAYPAVLDLSEPQEGVSVILGRDAEDHFGASLHARDLDADGAEELIVGAAQNRLSATFAGDSRFDGHGFSAADGANNSSSDAGEVYVFFGGAGERLPPVIDLASPLDPGVAARLTTIFGTRPEGAAGEELTTGDFNGDGFPDLVIGALSARNIFGTDLAGVAYVLYWRPGFRGQTIDLAEPPSTPRPPGLVLSEIYGVRARDILGDTLSAGDIDHDGIDDLALGIPHYDRDFGDIFDDTGAVALVYGREAPFPRLWSPQSDVTPPNLRLTFVLGSQPRDLMSYSMEIRDVDRDGYADLFPNAMRGDGGDNRRSDAGEATLISGFHLSGSQVGLTRVEPASGPVGESTSVLIRGGGFTTREDTRLELDGAEVLEFQVLSNCLIEAVFPPASQAGTRDLALHNRHGEVCLLKAFRDLDEDEGFVRGDANLDRVLDISDPLTILSYLFLGGSSVCEDAADVDDDSEVAITDAIYFLLFFFLGQDPPPPPYPDPGLDPTQDSLGCNP
jgi:hypothetical protein